METVVSNGRSRKNGNKMSKRLGNVVDPFKTIKPMAPTPPRWYPPMHHHGTNLKFDEEGIREVQFALPARYAIPTSFLHCMPNVDGFTFKEAISPWKKTGDRPLDHLSR